MEGKERKRENKKRRKIGGREKKVEQERANKIDICTEWKRDIGNNKMTNKNKKAKIRILYKNEFNECSELFALTSNSGPDTVDRGFLSVSVHS
jgi:hypothetical protein